MLILNLAVTETLLLLEIVDDHFYQESQKEDLHQDLLQKIFLVGLKKGKILLTRSNVSLLYNVQISTKVMKKRAETKYNHHEYLHCSLASAMEQ